MLNISNIKKNLTIIILCGGKGDRLKPLTKSIPKPLIKINKKTILDYILSHLEKFKIKNIVLATGYKSNMFEEYVKKNYKNKNFKIFKTPENKDIIYRIKDAMKKINSDAYIICYGDTILDININKLLNFFKKNVNKIIISGYQLQSSFGIFDIENNNKIRSFDEKPSLGLWFNVGYMVIGKKNIINLTKFKSFEKFLISSAKKKKFMLYKHYGKHITVNTFSELEKAKKEINSF